MEQNYDKPSPYSALNIEFGYLSNLTGNVSYRSKIDRILPMAIKANVTVPPRGMFRNGASLDFYKHTHQVWPKTIAQSGGNFVDYLFKSWMMGGRKNDTLKNLTIAASEHVYYSLIKTKKNTTYVSVVNDSSDPTHDSFFTVPYKE